MEFGVYCSNGRVVRWRDFNNIEGVKSFLSESLKPEFRYESLGYDPPNGVYSDGECIAVVQELGK